MICRNWTLTARVMFSLRESFFQDWCTIVNNVYNTDNGKGHTYMITCHWKADDFVHSLIPIANSFTTVLELNFSHERCKQTCSDVRVFGIAFFTV